MTPGPRKKNANRRGTPDTQQDSKKIVQVNKNPQIDKEKDLPLQNSGELGNADSTGNKYSKRSIKSNWDKYEEPNVDLLADKMRGNDFDVLISYSGGAGSQLQMQDEKDWDDAYTNEKNIALDFQDLIHAVKSVPFHERNYLPLDIFNEKQLTKFISVAENWKMTCKSKRESPLAFEEKISGQPTADSDLNIVENSESSSDSEDVINKSCVIEEKTADIIESLTSSLSLKTWAQEKAKDVVPEVKEEQTKASDDLDFLLSLNISPKVATNEAKPETPKTDNVDDWLNSILDD